MNNRSTIKEKLYQSCIDYINCHIEINSRVVEQAQQAVNGETKNTAGDRYETERAMKQRETELYGKRLEEVLHQRTLLLEIDASKEYSDVQPGALVRTPVGNFFIAISSDEVIIDEEEYCNISIDSPIGMAMAGKKSGETFKFRGKVLTVDMVC